MEHLRGVMCTRHSIIAIDPGYRNMGVAIYYHDGREPALLVDTIDPFELYNSYARRQGRPELKHKVKASKYEICLMAGRVVNEVFAMYIEPYGAVVCIERQPPFASAQTKVILDRW